MSPDKLSCEEVIEQLFTYLDGELDHVHSEAIGRHLEHCRDCFSRAQFEERLRQRIRESAMTQAPDRLRNRVKWLLDRY